jgi:acetyl esterase
MIPADDDQFEEASMTSHGTSGYEIDVQDVEYLSHGGRPLLARMFTPRGDGPFPMIVDLHGGAWCRGDRTNDTIMNEPLARSGVVVAALDFRMPPDASYPGSLVDISYGIRWLKGRARELHGRPDGLGIMGASSGAHQAMLLAMKPREPKYAALPSPADAAGLDGSVRCAVLCWPVIDPLGRYRYAKKLKAGGAPYPEVVDRVLPGHDQYWITEDAMAEGSPTLALERGEAVETPPVLYIQGTRDMAHPRADLDRFVAGYRKAGGQLDLELLEGEAEGYINRKPASPAVERTISRIIEFVHKQLG